MICFAILMIAAHHVCAAEWIGYASTPMGEMYYDKNSIKDINQSIIPLQSKTILSEEAKPKYFSLLKAMDKAPENPSLLNYYLELIEIDCVNKKRRTDAISFYDEKNNLLYSSPEEETGRWEDILADSIGATLKKIACHETATRKKTAGSVIVGRNKDALQMDGQEKDLKTIPEEAIRNLLNQWLAGWESGDMKKYRSCYASDFQSRAMNLESWISYKTNLFQKNKNIHITIDDLQLSVAGNHARAVFIQSYNSSTLKDSGKKTLELRKINGEWKIYREFM